MSWAHLAAAVLAISTFAPISRAQAPDAAKCREAEFDSHSEVLDDVAPFAGASYKSTFVVHSGGGNCKVIAFYRLAPKLPPAKTQAERRRVQNEYRDKLGTPFLAARYVEDSQKAYFVPRWTDQTRCPALVPALQRLEPTLAPKLTGDGPYRGMLSGVTDLPTIRFWLTGPVYPQRDPDYTLDIAVEGGGPDTFGGWLADTFKALDKCWSPDKPAPP